MIQTRTPILRLPPRPMQRCSAPAWIVLVCVLGGQVVIGGCQRTLFRASDNRTQFDTTDQMRRRNVPLVEVDEFGNPQPALRARLGRRR